MIELLHWDSHFFNMKIGRVQINPLTSKALNELYAQKAEGGFDLIYLFCHSGAPQNEAFIRERNGLLVDLKVTYHKTIIEKPIIHLPHVTVYAGPLTNDLLELALASGHQSRFKKDPKLEPFYESLYTQWISKSLDGSMADAVLAHHTEGRITGFVTLTHKALVGHIGLIAVHAEERGKGIGRQLLQAADNWYQANQMKTCTVVTQQDNLAACSLYESNGYAIEKTERIYHI